MSKCTSTIIEDEIKLMKLRSEEVMEEFRKSGKVTNPFLDGLGIPRDEDAIDRDELTLCRQDCLIITHADSISAFKKYQQEKFERTNPELKELKQKEEKAKLTIIKHANQLKKKKEKEIAAAAEKVRKASLTAEERKLELSNKRVIS